MWVPSVTIQYFDRLMATAQQCAESLQVTAQSLREDLAGIRAENQLLKNELQSAKINGDWLRIKVNQLELQNAALLQKAYNIQIPVPEIVRTPNPAFGPNSGTPFNFSFDDMGDKAAAALGLPIYGLEPNGNKE